MPAMRVDHAEGFVLLLQIFDNARHNDVLGDIGKVSGVVGMIIHLRLFSRAPIICKPCFRRDHHRLWMDLANCRNHAHKCPDPSSAGIVLLGALLHASRKRRGPTGWRQIPQCSCRHDLLHDHGNGGIAFHGPAACAELAIPLQHPQPCRRFMSGLSPRPITAVT